MKRFSAIAAIILFVLSSCSTTGPEKYFDLAVLNCNTMVGFAGDGMLRQLEQPSARLVEGSATQTVSLRRREVINAKIRFVEKNLENLKSLKPTDETRLMLNKSIELNQYILSVYQNEYSQLALLYDEGADREDTYQLAQEIHDRHARKFAMLFAELAKLGKEYADRHGLKVNWKV